MITKSNVKRNKRAGREAEKRVAKSLGGIRVGIYGQHDVELPDFAIEVKSRVSSVLHTFMEQAVRNAGDKIPMVVVHKPDKTQENNIVCLRMKDWLLIQNK